MGVYLTRPRVSDLVFQVYDRPLHPELFDILAARKVQREDYRLMVRITRTGHVISWENAEFFLTEVAAAGAQHLPEHRRLRHWRLPRRTIRHPGLHSARPLPDLFSTRSPGPGDFPAHPR